MHSESQRLLVLRATQLLDSPPERAFDRMTRLASSLLGAPVALVSLVDDKRQFFKSSIGLAEPWATLRETPLTHSFCQYVTRDRALLVVTDAREHPQLRHNLAVRDLHVVAYAGVPLIVGDEAVGAFCVIDDKPRGWSAADLALLDDLAQTVVSEIDLRLALHAAREQRALTEALLESLADGVLAIDATRTFIVVNRAARAMFSEVDTGGSLAPDRAAYSSVLAADGSPLGLEDGPLGRGLRGETTDDLQLSFQRLDAAAPVFVEASGRPVHGAKGHVIAAVAVYRDVTEKKRLLDERERLLLVDTLTGVPNRRAAEAALRREGARVARAGTPMSVALFDIDYFKLVNDQFGHAAGDALLCRVAAALAAAGRLTDTVARWGGEEFLAVLPVALQGAVAFCERARQRVARIACPPVALVTISAGVAQVAPGESPEAAVARADRCLYDAKRSGRNRVRS